MNNSLLDLLRTGGYILYVRHGESNVGEDLSNLDFHLCYTQRNLSQLGRRQAIYYGSIIRSLQIPIEYPVITSPFCRAIRTAELAFGSMNVQVDPFWYEIYNLNKNITPSEQERILMTLKSKLEIIPDHGTNQVIIAHSFPDRVGLGQIPDMGTVLIKPLGKGNGYEVIDTLTLDDLSAIARV